MTNNRFQDEKKILSDFFKEVWVKCPRCEKKAITKVDHEKQQAQLLCEHCGYHRERQTQVQFYGQKVQFRTSADFYFDTELWFQMPFKNSRFEAYNLEHLEYLERYVAATLREHKDRTGFTLLEKLPKFYHEAKNREVSLRIIQRLKSK